MGLFRRKRPSPAKPTHAARTAAATAHSVEHGPTWMAADDWMGRLRAYRGQGRSDADIRDIITHLQRRGPHTPQTPTEAASRAATARVVARAEFMDPDTEARALAPSSAGLPDVRLRRERDRLVVVTPLGWVNPRSRTSYRAGLHSFVVAGTAHHEAAVKAGRFSPGTPVRLVREPTNVYDPNAIAVYAETGRRPAGYVPKGRAKRLAAMLDAGTDVVAISMRGSGTGSDGVAPVVLVCDREMYQHLTR